MGENRLNGSDVWCTMLLGDRRAGVHKLHRYCARQLPTSSPEIDRKSHRDDW
jgi:hypothetical protein